ncbi:fungal-specific transcription factor domain-containing protein [Mycena capillaripes]|nr:fungal-specific transcription factor domain-containing protein [Mycena capillaripes]
MASPPPKDAAPVPTEDAADKPSQPSSKKPRQRKQQTEGTFHPIICYILNSMPRSSPAARAPVPAVHHEPSPRIRPALPPAVPPPPPPGTPGAPQYAYPVHPSPYPAHYYPQYPPQMMIQQRNVPQQDSASAGLKRKRKSAAGGSGSAARKDKDDDDDEGASPSDLTPAQQKAQALELKKRTKTQRAAPKCQHCKQYAFDCTFFLPITETRFKKKKLEEDENKDNKSPLAEKRDSSVFGPTSAAHLLHSQASISSRIYEGYDSRYHHTFEVSKSGDGLIRVEKPAQSDQQPSVPKPVDLHIEPQIVEQLLNAYFSDVAPILPIMTQAEFLATPAPPPILLYSMCLVAAARREVPQSVFDSIRYAVNGVIKAEDVLSTPSMANVQALLILCMTGDCHSQFVPTALSAMWARLGSAIRMAQDLGLHRAELVKQDIELRRRVWGACLISDRWASLVYGFPYMIDVHDCDVRLPSSGDSKDLYMDELVRLSVIGGRVVKTIYSPSGLTLISDEILYKLLADIEAWKANLPENLKFRGAETPQSAGLLHLLYTSVCMIFWRVFMRISYSCPAHLKFGLTVEQWSSLVTLTGESIDWLDAHERVYDVWLLVAYAATSCAFVQTGPEAVAKLKKLRDCVRRWEGSISPDHMSARRKAPTQGPQLPLEAPVLNPTGGVKGKQPASLNYQPDPTRPGGGVFIAHKDSQDDFEDLPAGTVIKDGVEGGEAASGGKQGAGTTMVNLTPLTTGGSGGRGSHSNVNPAMNMGVGANPVQVMNVLDAQAGNTLADLAMTDTALLEGIPGEMFNWGQWDSFFSRMNHGPNATGEPPFNGQQPPA